MSAIASLESWQFCNQSDEALEDFKCQICFNVLNEPVQCKKGHLFCNDCVGKWLATNETCPTCKTSLKAAELSENLFVRNAINQLEVCCPHRESQHGPHDLAPPPPPQQNWAAVAAAAPALAPADAAIADHYNDECPMNGVSICRTLSFSAPSFVPNSAGAAAAGAAATTTGCQWRGNVCALREHLSKGCTFATAPCPHCHTCVERGEAFTEHLSMCDAAVLSCSCRRRFARRDLAAHQEHCPEITIECPFASHGCRHPVRRRDFNTHQTKAAQYHARLMSKKIEDIEKGTIFTNMQWKLKYPLEDNASSAVSKRVEIDINKLNPTATAPCLVRLHFSLDVTETHMELFLHASSDSPSAFPLSFGDCEISVLHTSGEVKRALRHSLSGSIASSGAGRGYRNFIELDRLTPSKFLHENGYVIIQAKIVVPSPGALTCHEL